MSITTRLHKDAASLAGGINHMRWRKVHFRPWVGRHYQSGFAGVRLLVLGESHYDWDGRPQDERECTRFVAQIYADDDERKRFATNLEMVATGARLCRQQKNEFWHSIAFYNYIQSLVGDGPRQRPTATMWNAAEEPFFEVLSQLRPQAVLVLGRGLWNWMPAGSNGTVLPGPRKDLSCEYTVGRHTSVAFPVHHPSSGFSSSAWRPRVLAGLKAARLLTKR
jgi:hypothetical protein